MRLIDLPPEVLLCITDQLDHAQDISRLARVTRRTFRTFQDALFRFAARQENCSALHYAARWDRCATVEALLRYGANTNALFGTCTPLIIAAGYGSASVLDLLLRQGDLNANAQNQNAETALWCAAYSGHRKTVMRLLRCKNIERDVADSLNAMTPFTVAVANRHIHVAADLLATRSIDVNARDKNYQTAVYYAITSHDHEMTTLLLFNGEVEVNIQDRLQRTPFWYAVRCNNLLATKYLLMRGANPNIPDMDCIAPLNIAIIEGYVVILRLLLDKYEVDISPRLNLAFSMVREAQLPVCVAVYVGNHHALRHLLRRGADVNAHDSLGYSLLHLTVRKADSVMVKLLLGHKCLEINRKTRDKSSFTALHEAAAGGCLSMVNLLLSKEDIDLNVKDINGRTPLWWATRNNHPFIAKRLLAESGLDANAASTGGSTPLHHAVCHRSRLMMLSLLAEDSLNPNICAKDGLSPLGWAVANGDRVMVNLLLTRTDTRPSFACFKLALEGGYYGILFRLLRHSHKDS